MTPAPSYIDLRPGMVLHVIPRAGALTDAFATVIRHVTEQDITVDAPGSDGSPLVPGSEITVFVQSGGRIYRLESQVLVLEPGGGAAGVEGAMVLEHPVAADQTERRDYYRLLTTITPRYAARVTTSDDELERIEARILDLSGGGLQLHTRDWVPVGSRIRLVFALEHDAQEVDACVLALSVVRPGPRRSLHRVHCRFVDMPRAERERVVRFVFASQIDARQRGVA